MLSPDNLGSAAKETNFVFETMICSVPVVIFPSESPAKTNDRFVLLACQRLILAGINHPVFFTKTGGNHNKEDSEEEFNNEETGTGKRRSPLRRKRKNCVFCSVMGLFFHSLLNHIFHLMDSLRIDLNPHRKLLGGFAIPNCILSQLLNSL